MTKIECGCKVCEKNAAKIGKPLPLAALVPDALLAACGGKVHGLVYSAHDPTIIGERVRATTGMRAA